jgi:hypothetical protein
MLFTSYILGFIAIATAGKCIISKFMCMVLTLYQHLLFTLDLCLVSLSGKQTHLLRRA